MFDDVVDEAAAALGRGLNAPDPTILAGPDFWDRIAAFVAHASAVSAQQAWYMDLATLLTDNGIQFCDLPKHRSGPTARWRTHMFDLLCQQHGIEHRLTKPNHSWANGQVERMNRTLKEATTRRTSS